MTTAPLLQVTGISKRFGVTRALDGVDLTISAGERVAVMGENGAGKSTLMKVLSGVYSPDSGTIELDGAPYSPASPFHALAAGISTVYQEPAVFAHLSVLENLYAGDLPRTKLGNVDDKRMKREAAALLDRLRLPARLAGADMGELSLAEQQLVLIARAVKNDAKLLILDEPTSILTHAESETLFSLVDQLSAAGTAVLYITHRFDELDKVADRFVVLRDGALVGEIDVPDQSRILAMMGGRSSSSVEASAELNDTISIPTVVEDGERVLSIRGLTVDGRFEDISLDVHAGEIVGLYGLVGAGRTEVALTVFGVLEPDAGTMTLSGTPFSPTGPADALRNGVAYLPEDRKTQGILPFMNIRENLVAATLYKLTTSGFISRKREREVTNRWMQTLAVKAAGTNAPITSLSGGNQQKVLLARAVATEPTLLILDEPTRGIDVATKTDIHTDIGALARGGTAILLISSELPELLGLADRVHVLREGRMIRTLSTAEATEDAVLRAAVGLSDEAAPDA
ncbi:sugar ABC transporter ATP-binding protein [Plantibacter sp. Mn2098]|uniref:sugar ABC transporter ATP-binding protein n=1 Tax=Plantibacter sp. Mn2098 TaxID=3395266 RepID=UPI003BCDFEFF